MHSTTLASTLLALQPDRPFSPGISGLLVCVPDGGPATLKLRASSTMPRLRPRPSVVRLGASLRSSTSTGSGSSGSIGSRGSADPLRSSQPCCLFTATPNRPSSNSVTRASGPSRASLFPSGSSPLSSSTRRDRSPRPLRVLRAQAYLLRRFFKALTLGSLASALLAYVLRLRLLLFLASLLLVFLNKAQNPLPSRPTHVRYSTFLTAVSQGRVSSVRLEPGSTRVWFNQAQPGAQAEAAPSSMRLGSSGEAGLLLTQLSGQQPASLATGADVATASLAEPQADISRATTARPLGQSDANSALLQQGMPKGNDADLATSELTQPKHLCWREEALIASPALAAVVKPCPDPAYQFVCHRLLQDDGFLLKMLHSTGTPFAAVPRPASEKITRVLLEAGLLWLGLAPFMVLALRTISGRNGGGWKPFARKSKGGKGRQGVGFGDVAGVDVAKAELLELVRCLRSNASGNSAVATLGAQLPRGVLLVGPPGTGKTLLARALAWEAGVPFFSASGSEFVELFVGRGAARVRELFQAARKAAPAVIFIDEIDAVGSARGRGNNEEREQTLNQLLTELDGFDTQDDGVLLLAATNRVDVLDPALCRAGRISRRVLVPLPDEQGRRDILLVHLRAKACEGGQAGKEAAAAAVAAFSPGFSGAELQNVVNEAALLAIREGSTEISLSHLQDAVLRSRWGVGTVQGSGPVVGLAKWLQRAAARNVASPRSAV